MIDFIIKQAETGDEVVILDFIRKLADYEELPGEVVASEENLRESLFSNTPSAGAIIGYFEGKPIGVAVYFFNFSTFKGKQGLYLEDIIILPEYRGHGFGKEMMKHLARLAVESGCSRFEWAVLDWNIYAIDFYKSLGAEPMDGWTVFRLYGDKLKELAD